MVTTIIAPPVSGRDYYRPAGYHADGSPRRWVRCFVTEVHGSMCRSHDADCLPIGCGSAFPWRSLSETQPYPDAKP